MAQPTAYDITIKVNDVDVTTYVPYDSLSFDDYARQVSQWRMSIDNPSGVTPAKGHSVEVTANSLAGTPVIFVGYIVELETKKRENGVSVIYECDCADRKILLQKSVVPYNQYTGLDSSILSSLLSNAYPDLSSTFDFATDINSFADDLALLSNEDSLLDLLNELAAQADADWRMDTLTTTDVVNFDATGYTDYEFYDDGSGFIVDTEAVTATGNPGNAAQGTSSYAANDFEFMYVQINLPAEKDITRLDFDFYWDLTVTGGGSLQIDVIARTAGTDTAFATMVDDDSLSNAGTWQSINTDDDDPLGQWAASAPYTADTVRIQLRLTHNNDASWDDLDFRIDNVQITCTDGCGLPIGAGKDNLQWNAAENNTDTTDFNIDVQSGDEFAFDLDLFEGDWDDFNSVTVVGGSEQSAVDWTYESDGDMEHINLETEIKDLVVYINDGSDGSPSWTLQDDGILGTDKLTSQGGSKDVLYDATRHWLWFDTAPPALSKSVRVTGSILIPIRIRVENVPAGQPTYATTINNPAISTIDEAVTVGQAALNQRSSIKRMTFKTYEPGLKPGQKMTVADSARGLNETLIIQRISTKWLGASGYALFDVTAGDDEQSSADVLIANNDKRSRDNLLRSVPTTQTANLLTDDSGTIMTDDNNTEMYEVT